MSFDDFAAVRNVSDPQISPSGASVLYALRTTDVSKNARTTVTYLIPAAGGTPRRLAVFDDPCVAVVRGGWGFGGGRMYYSVEERQSDVWVMEVERH